MIGYKTQVRPDYPKPKVFRIGRLIKYTEKDEQAWNIIDGPLVWGKTKCLSVFWCFFYIYWDNDLFWFRFFGGYGLHGRRNYKDRFILFSERMGLTKTYKAFGWVFKILKP